MDQPYSRIADALLDYQYWSPNDPQKTPYDDTGWTFPELVQRAGRARHRREGARRADGAASTGEVARRAASTSTGDRSSSINHNADNALVTLRYASRTRRSRRPKSRSRPAARSSTAGRSSSRTRRPADLAEGRRRSSACRSSPSSAAPSVKTHPVRARAHRAPAHLAEHADRRLVAAGVRQRCRCRTTTSARRRSRRTPTCSAKYDVIVFRAGRRGNPQAIVNGMPMCGNPMPWKKTAETPNLGIGRSDRRHASGPRLGRPRAPAGVRAQGRPAAHGDGHSRLRGVVRLHAGRVGRADASACASSAASCARRWSTTTSPIVYGYTDNLAIWCDERADLQRVEHRSAAAAAAGSGRDDGGTRPTGRGTADDPDVPQGRTGVEMPTREPRVERGKRCRVTDEQLRNRVNVIPPAQRPRVMLRYADTRELLVSGLLENGGEIAQHAAVVDVAGRQGARGAVLEQPDLARRDARAATSWCSTRS